MSAALKEKTESLIKDNAVMVFSKSYCPYCKATKKTLENAGAKFTVYELNEESAYSLFCRPPPPTALPQRFLPLEPSFRAN